MNKNNKNNKNNKKSVVSFFYNKEGILQFYDISPYLLVDMSCEFVKPLYCIQISLSEKILTTKIMKVLQF